MKQPPDMWLKCNIGITLPKDKVVSSGSSLLRDSRGLVLLNSRSVCNTACSIRFSQDD